MKASCPILCCVLLAVSLCDAGKSDFIAAVFENRPAHDVNTMSPEQVVSSNLKGMEIAAEEAAKRGADILLLSEYGANPVGTRTANRNYAEHIPDPRKVSYNPCNAQAAGEKPGQILSRISCMAKKHKMYIVMGLLDIQPCTKETLTCDATSIEGCECAPSCPKDGNFMYNTAAAFDREGNVVARYHKNHLYFEDLNTPQKPDMITFETDFGVFGLLICFDSVFVDVVNLVKYHNVETLLFPTHWYDDTVPFNAVEWQQAWAIANHVNFMAANQHLPGNGTLGTGIYTKEHGALAYTYNPDGKSKLVISKVPRDGSPKPSGKIFVIDENGVHEVKDHGDDFPEQCYEDLVGPPNDFFHDYRCFKHQTESYNLKKLRGNKGKVESCFNTFCCSLKYDLDDTIRENYYLATFNGKNDLNGYFKWHEETCMLVRCDSFENKQCVTFPSKAKTVFRSLELTAQFKSKIVYPTVSKSHYRLAPKSEWTLEKKDDFVVLKFHSQINDPILKVGLMGRNYAEDPPLIPFYGF